MLPSTVVGLSITVALSFLMSSCLCMNILSMGPAAVHVAGVLKHTPKLLSRSNYESLTSLL